VGPKNSNGGEDRYKTVRLGAGVPKDFRGRRKVILWVIIPFQVKCRNLAPRSLAAIGAGLRRAGPVVVYFYQGLAKRGLKRKGPAWAGQKPLAWRERA
jgi:hypothetical protein